METTRNTTLKLIAFAALIFTCAGVPHFLFDRARPAQASLPDSELTALFPDRVGEYVLKSRMSSDYAKKPFEQVGIFVNPANHEIAQVSVLLDSSSDNGIDCYRARGLSIRWRSTEEVQALDSVASFDVALLEAPSIDSGAGASLILIASSECAPGRCAQLPSPDALTEIFQTQDASRLAVTPMSIVLQPAMGNSQLPFAARKDALMRDFRRFMASFPLHPMRQVAQWKLSLAKLPSH